SSCLLTCTDKLDSRVPGGLALRCVPQARLVTLPLAPPSLRPRVLFFPSRPHVWRVRGSGGWSSRNAIKQTAQMWKLAIEDDEGKQTVVPLTRDEYTIGRKDGNTIRLTERNVSREHARLLKKKSASESNGNGENGKSTVVLEDLTSYNGVFVNGLRVTHSQNLTHGDLVQIGDYRIVL